MQNVQSLLSMSARVSGVEKTVESSSSAGPGGEMTKKLQTAVASQHSQPQETECRVPRVARDQILIPNQNEKSFQASVVADKYLLLDQVEGSSLYRCMDVNTQEELVCKVSCKKFAYNLFRGERALLEFRAGPRGALYKSSVFVSFTIQIPSLSDCCANRQKTGHLCAKFNA